MLRKLLFLILLGILNVGMFQCLVAQTVILDASKDTHIRTDQNLRRNDNYGCDSYLIVGSSRGGGGIPWGEGDAMRSFIELDLSGLPQGKLTRAVLELSIPVLGVPNNTPPSTYKVDVHRVIPSSSRTPWQEGNGFETKTADGCVHSDLADGMAWKGGVDPYNYQGATLGIDNQTQPDFDPVVEASTFINESTANIGDVYQWDITSLVQSWLDGTYPNYGIMLHDTTSEGTFKWLRFGAREERIYNVPGAVDGPRLVLTFDDFQVNGDALAVGNNCYILTPDLPGQGGSVWSKSQVDLTLPFELNSSIYLGSKNGGGSDGITFTFQGNSNTALGMAGGYLGYEGISPSLAIEFDTYRNSYFADPSYDHMAVISNGSVNHSLSSHLAGPVYIVPGQSYGDDGLSHELHIEWDPVIQKLDVFLDGDLRLAYTGDIINSVFGGNSLVYWGFTGATGGGYNLQKVCINSNIPVVVEDATFALVNALSD
ncbi:MAG: DNRLRE domain-containing protein, partial [Bacteroidetes bacterium]|nr:DNRLRE domain-containing protein [Bacteroidota bacterium]